MLLEFTVGNYRSFNKKCTLSFEAQSITDQPQTNIAKFGKYKVLKTTAIYGANSSGKSNLINAINAMGRTVITSVKLNNDDDLDFDPFLLSNKENEPTYFEVLFLHGTIRYRYGFEYNQKSILNEWLFTKEEKKKEKVLFIRNVEGIGVAESDFPEGVGNEEKTNENRLFLSLCAQLGGTISKTVMEWFHIKINTISGLDNFGYQDFSKKMFHKKIEGFENAHKFFNSLKLGFDHLVTTEEELDIPNDLPVEIKNLINKQNNGKKLIVLHSVHNKYDKRGEISGETIFNVEDQESSGTRKLIDLAGPIFDTLLNGSTLVVDELDAKMHPLISQHIIGLFNDPKTNPKDAQLIFTTHDTHLLSSKMLRRDQIWFTEKDSVEQTDLYSLMDIVLPDGSKPRNDSNYEKNYIAGRYGAIPFIIND